MQKLLIFSDLRGKTEENKKAIHDRIAFYTLAREQRTLEERERQMLLEQAKLEEIERKKVLLEKQKQAKLKQELMDKHMNAEKNKNKLLLDEAKRLMTI